MSSLLLTRLRPYLLAFVAVLAIAAGSGALAQTPTYTRNFSALESEEGVRAYRLNTTEFRALLDDGDFSFGFWFQPKALPASGGAPVAVLHGFWGA
ncbi:MAG: hypothetical protein ACR2RV_13320, partial [Verrucomicrobiales bacterium]